jgi:hypothetical protein
MLLSQTDGASYLSRTDGKTQPGQRMPIRPLGYPSGSVSMSAHTISGSHVMPQASQRAVAFSQCSSCYRHNACRATTY